MNKWIAGAALAAIISGVVMTNKSRAIRNNNPGNLRFYNIGWVGEIGQDDDGFSIFDSMENGIRASYVNMRTKYGRGITTIGELIPIWAPAHENDVVAYVNFVSKRTGIPSQLSFDFDRDAEAIIAAIFRFEAGEEIPKEILQAGIALA